MTKRQLFCKEMRKDWQPMVIADIPNFVLLGLDNHIEQNVTFSYHGLGAEKFNNWELIPHIGVIEIGHDNTILDGSIIMRATKDKTVIGNGNILGVRSHIGHNTTIGDRNLIGSGVMIGGSVIVGNDCDIGMGAIIRNKVKIGNNVVIGMGSVVTKDIPDNCVVYGNPAKIR